MTKLTVSILDDRGMILLANMEKLGLIELSGEYAEMVRSKVTSGDLSLEMLHVQIDELRNSL